MPGHRYVEDIDSASMLATKRLTGVAPEVNLKEFVTCMPMPSTNKASHSVFKPRGVVTKKSKTRVSVAHQKGLMSSKNFKK